MSNCMVGIAHLVYAARDGSAAHIRSANVLPGPAGNVLAAWRRLVGQFWRTDRRCAWRRASPPRSCGQTQRPIFFPGGWPIARCHDVWAVTHRYRNQVPPTPFRRPQLRPPGRRSPGNTAYLAIKRIERGLETGIQAKSGIGELGHVVFSDDNEAGAPQLGDNLGVLCRGRILGEHMRCRSRDGYRKGLLPRLERRQTEGRIALVGAPYRPDPLLGVPFQ